MGDVLADPAAAEADPAHPARLGMAELFTADSPYIEDFGQLLTGYLNQEVESMAPGESGDVQQTTFLWFTEAAAVEPDFVSFVFCTYSDAQIRLAGGGSSADVGVTQGAGEARRVDGVWLLHRLRQLGHETSPPGTPDPCPDLASDEQGS